MSKSASRKPNRRTFLKGASMAAAVAAAGVGCSGYWSGRGNRAPKTIGKKVIVIGIDGMDPRLTETMMNWTDEKGRPKLPNLAKLRDQGGFSPLGTSIPPQSPVAWANFINGAGPGSHGIFDFIHRDPHQQCLPTNSIAGVIPGEGHWDYGDYRLQLDFWPFNHKPPVAHLQRQGVPFWDYLDAAGVPTTFYDLPSNYPPSPSQHGHHRCLCGMGTPDMLGNYPTYQHFSENCPPEGINKGSGRQSRLTFENETAHAKIVGPDNSFLKSPRSVEIPFHVHRDKEANAAVIEIQGKKILLRVRDNGGQWSKWVKVNLEFDLPWFVPNEKRSTIVRFFLQEVSPNFRLYVSPLNVDPAAPAMQVSEPASFIEDVARKRGPFYTTGFQEEYSARKDNLFSDEEYRKQANIVLEERLALFDYAVNDYSDGLLFFYFSSSDLQSHMFWWNWNYGEEAFHPSRTTEEVSRNFDYVMELYQRLDQVVGTLMDRYGSAATLFVMSDHGFANFGRQFNLNSWLRDFGYLSKCNSIMTDADWSVTYAYGLGINGLYLNLKGRELYGIVEPGAEAEAKLTEIKERLEEVVDPATNQRVISRVYRASEVYSGDATALAPDLIVGYSRGYRSSWETCLGDLEQEVLSDNKMAWSADHCADALEVPGVLLCSRKFGAQSPALVDVAPSILAEFGVPAPSTMTGKSIFT